MKFNKKMLLVPILIIVDQISKFLVLNFLTSEKIIIENFISLNLVNNTGVAFGLNSGQNMTNIFIGILFIFIIVRFLISQKNNIDSKTEIIIYMILAGGISNLIDRIIRGAVVDFINVKNFSVFNIADIYIVVGWILFIIFLILYLNKDVKKIKE